MNPSSQIKTYSQVNRKNEKLTFGISRMEAIYDRRGGATDVAHRHDFYTLLIVKKAKGQHVIDFKSYPLQDLTVHFIAPGQVHQVIEEERSIGFSVVFSEDFLISSNIPSDFIQNLNLFHDFGESPPLLISEELMEKLVHYSEEMQKFSERVSPMSYEAIGALLKLILIHCNNHCVRQPDLISDSGNNVLQSFKKLVDNHFKEWHATSQYAEALFISADYLNRLVKSNTGKTAKEYIQSRITVEAKRMIHFSGLSNKEIAFDLGFTEPANFSAFFKNCVGASPTDFKRTLV